MEEVRRSDAGLILIVTPKSVIPTWERHIKMLFPEAQRDVMKVKVARSEAPMSLDCWATYDRYIVVTNWEQIHKPVYQKVKWDYVIADECHFAANRKTRRTKALKKLRATHKRALTGSPIINRPDEVWSILNWMFPKRYTSYWRWFEQYVEAERHNKGTCEVCGNWHQREFREILGPKNTQALKQELAQYTLRRLKKHHLKDLPDKFYDERVVDLTPQQRRVYEEMKDEALAWVGQFNDVPLPAPQAIAQLTRLRQIASATPVEVNHDDDGSIKVTLGEPSPKLDVMMEVIQGTDQQVVVFSTSSQLIKLAQARLAKANIPYARIIGEDNDQQRAVSLKVFTEGAARVFLATIGAGGTGIDGLQVASIAIFLDRSWSPAQNTQAEGRLHRSGQKSAVQVIRIIARDTVDEAVEEKLQLKQAWFRDLFGGGD